MSTWPAEWRCSVLVSTVYAPGRSQKCPTMAKVCTLDKRHWCAFHAWERRKLALPDIWWRPGELADMLQTAEEARG